MAQERTGAGSTPTSVAGVLSLHKIKPRVGESARVLNLHHVVDLAESIQAVGLVQGIAVDRLGHVLAGEHRRAAMITLAAAPDKRSAVLLREAGTSAVDRTKDSAWAERLAKLPAGTGELDIHRVPVRIFDLAADDPRRFEVEVTENEKRRDFTPAEVKALWTRLESLGYRTTPGKPKKGQPSGVKAMTTILGKGERTVRRMIRKAEGVPDMRPLGRVSEPAARGRLLRELRTYKFQHAENAKVASAIDALLEALKVME